MSLISDIQKSLQYAVSGDKYRYTEGRWDLDLTYITPRIIAMGIPGEGVSSNWRNHIKDVSSFFRSKHAGHYKIINLSGVYYNYSLFDNMVVDFGFPDHHPPPLELYLRTLVEMHNWLQRDPKNVVSVHCLAGRSRTGTIIAGYLMYASFCKDAREAIQYFNNKRSLEAKDIVLPSQIRYVGYMDLLLHDHSRTAIVAPATRVLRSICVSPVFRLEGSVAKGKATWKPCILIQEQALPQTAIFKKHFPSVSMTTECARLDVPGIVMTGDMMITIGHISSNAAKFMRAKNKIHRAIDVAQDGFRKDLTVDITRISFHTSFIEGDVLIFQSNELDAHKAGPLKCDDKYIPSSVIVTLEFEPFSNDIQKYPISPRNLSPSTSANNSIAETKLPDIQNLSISPKTDNTPQTTSTTAASTTTASITTEITYNQPSISISASPGPVTNTSNQPSLNSSSNAPSSPRTSVAPLNLPTSSSDTDGSIPRPKSYFYGLSNYSAHSNVDPTIDLKIKQLQQSLPEHALYRVPVDQSSNPNVNAPNYNGHSHNPYNYALVPPNTAHSASKSAPSSPNPYQPSPSTNPQTSNPYANQPTTLNGLDPNSPYAAPQPRKRTRSTETAISWSSPGQIPPTGYPPGYVPPNVIPPTGYPPGYVPPPSYDPSYGNTSNTRQRRATISFEKPPTLLAADYAPYNPPKPQPLSLPMNLNPYANIPLDHNPYNQNWTPFPTDNNPYAPNNNPYAPDPQLNPYAPPQ